MIHLMLTFLIITLKVREDLWFCQSVYLIWSQSLIPKYFVSLCIFFRLATFKHTVLIRPGKNHLSAFTHKAAIFISQTDFVFEHRIAAAQKLSIRYKTLELYLIKDHYPLNIGKERLLHFFITKKFLYKKRLNAQSILHNSVLQ